MQCVYVLQSDSDGDLYIGCTQNIKERLALHNAKKVASTKSRVPFKLIYCELYLNKKDAFPREQYLKTGWGHNYLRKVLSNFFNSQEV